MDDPLAPADGVEVHLKVVQLAVLLAAFAVPAALLAAAAPALLVVAAVAVVAVVVTVAVAAAATLCVAFRSSILNVK